MAFIKIEGGEKMEIDIRERKQEENHLQKTLEIIERKISELGQQLYDKEEKIQEFKQLIWDTRHDMDAAEMKTMMTSNDQEIARAEMHATYFKKLFRIQESPYFGSIIFQEDGKKEEKIYIGITHVDENYDHYVHDWRAPICSLFYDYGVGDVKYDAPEGIIYGKMKNKRQYKIEHKELIHIFDNNLNIDDEVLQEVLSTEADDKMKNIVNTIQQEQNEVIRNIENDIMIVQGIAGSGKTSVALHRIAFLLYKIKNLSSNNILIFSPNQVFSEYISNVLPELGEENTLQCTFDGFLESNITEFRHVESFSKFIERHYKKTVQNEKFIEYKQSDQVMYDLDKYVSELEQKATFIDDLSFDKKFITKEELNQLLKRYKHFRLFEQLPAVAHKICDYWYDGRYGKTRQIVSKLYQVFSVPHDYKKLYREFFKGEIFLNSYQGNITEKEINNLCSNHLEIPYDDACLFAYLKGKLDGFEYRGLIKQVVIDEAQDYNKLQYQIIKNIFPKSGFTILGDINQTINPYYKYDTLEELKEIFHKESLYLELKKTYRSSEEIIEYTNKILNLQHIQAIRKKNHHPVLLKKEQDGKIGEQLLEEIEILKKSSKSIAIITKTDEEAITLYKELKKKNKEISLLETKTEKFNRDLVIVPSYIAKGLEFDSVILYTWKENQYTEKEKYLYYVACTRAQHQLVIYNQKAN